MSTLLRNGVMGLAAVASVAVVAAPADAQRYRHHRDRGGDRAAAAIVGGIVGVGLGAAIASSNRDRYYDRGYYDRGYYPAYADRGYYGRGYYDRGHYGRGYYGRGYDRPRCWTERVYDPYVGRRVRVRYCD